MKVIASVTLWVIISCPAWSQTMNDTIVNHITETTVTIDGQSLEDCWIQADWHAIDQVWIPYGTTMKQGDFEGRFKVAWDKNYLYILVEVRDDSLSDDYTDPYSHWWDDDCLEIFIDENRSMGDHERNCNAFAYHVSLSFDALDLNAAGQGINYKDNIEVDMDTIDEHTYLWEMAIKMYDATFNMSSPENSRVYLEPNKLMGLAIAYCDNDETTSRENFIGSMYMTPSHFNDMYKNADYFGPMVLTAPEDPTGVPENNRATEVNVFPVPAHYYLTVQVSSSQQIRNTVSISTLTGQIIRSESFNGNSQTIDIASLDAGIYLLQGVSGTITYSKIFVKQ